MFKKNQVLDVEGCEYKLIKHKGEGGTGIVWTAVSGEKQFAVKCIKSTKSHKDKLERFRAEIDFCKNTNHRNIVRVIAEGVREDTSFYIMPYYSKTLRQVINEVDDADLLIKYILKICAALKHIHSKGIRHRDIKPENILIEGRNLVLADFGVAHFKEYGLTKKGDWLANRNYMAPEQKIKNNAFNVDEAADIYALGLIINECFTKQNPTGSKYIKIADSYPLLHELDNLVESMIRQKAIDRIPITSVQVQIRFIQKRLKNDIVDMKYYLEMIGPPIELKRKILNEIYQRASEDILFGKFLFESHSRKELNRYNRNWHMKLCYKVDYFLYNLYVQERLLETCKNKFEYESNIYREDVWYRPLNLSEDKKHKLLYQEMCEILKKYDLKKNGYPLLDLSGQILKYFSSCADYHCIEILEEIQNIEDSAKHNLTSAPIIYIVTALKQSIIENSEALLNGINGLGGRFDFNFEDHILIDWDQSQNYEYNNDQQELVYSYYLEKQDELKKILTTFQRKWKVSYSKCDEEYYSIKFSTNNQFKKFCDYALTLSKPHYIFEGDVLTILDEPNYVGNMVELKLSTVFQIPIPLAQILGLKEIHS